MLWPTLRPKIEDSAYNLAAFRIVIGVLLFGCADLWNAVAVARLPQALRTSSHWFGQQLLRLPSVPSVVESLAYLTCAMGILISLGLLTRFALVVGTLSALYVLGIGQLGGSVWHGHHLIWFSALLAVSPCSDVWSVDAFLRRRKHLPHRSRDPLCYGLPIRIAWLLLAAILFFPGLWKLRGGGLLWIVSDNLRNQMHWKWVQAGGYLPWLRVDRFPALCKLLAASVVAFELGFPLLLLHKRSRIVAVCGALLFHLGTWLLMRIDFSILWPCYAVLIDWNGLREALTKPRPSPQQAEQCSLLPMSAVGVLLLAGVYLWGFLGWTQSYPFVCYPTFQYLANGAMPALLLTVEDETGRQQELPRPWASPSPESPRAVALMWSVLRSPSPKQLAAYLTELRTSPAISAALASRCPLTIHFDRVLLPVHPDSWQAPPVSRQRLHSLTLPCE